MYNILIVNNDKKTCKIVSESDIKKDNHVVCVSNTDEFNNLPETEKIQLLILVSTAEEYNENEFKFLLDVRSQFHKIPTVFIVTKLLFPQFIPIFDLGIDSIISRYSTDEEILNEIRKILNTIY